MPKKKKKSLLFHLPLIFRPYFMDPQVNFKLTFNCLHQCLGQKNLSKGRQY